MYATLGPFHSWDFLFFVALVLAGLVLVMHYWGGPKRWR